jgi:hypothetical protein
MMSLSDLTTGPITVFVFLNLTTVGWTQSCIITGGINLGTTTQNCIVVGPARLTFQTAIAEELISKLSPGKPIRLHTIGRDSDQKVADEYGRYLQSRGFKIAEHHIATYAIAPEPKYPITIRDEGSMIDLTIAPSAR